MKPREIFWVVGVVATMWAAGCATTETTATAPPVSMRTTADAIIHVSGLS